MPNVEIRVQGKLDPCWMTWFEGFSIQPGSNEEILLSGQLMDQGALYGVLSSLNLLGLKLIACSVIEDHPLPIKETE